MYKKILLATDGSKNAIDAAKRLVELHKAFGSKIVIFHAEKHYYVPATQEPRSFPFFDLGLINRAHEIEQQKMQQAFLKWGKKMLEDTKEIFDKEGIDVETRLIRDESPVDYVKHITKEEGFDLVAAGCKGHHSKLKEIFLGSVAHKISNEAYCDVLIVR